MTSALDRIARVACPASATAVTCLPCAADDLHHDDAEGIEQRRVDRDDGEIPGQRPGPVGALGDRQAEEQRVREQAAEADGDASVTGRLKSRRAPRKPAAKPEKAPM